MEELKNTVLNKTPEEFGYNTSIWTAPLLIEWVKREFNITYSDDAIYIILKHKLKLRHKKAKGFYLEAEKEKREEFINTLKKTD